MRDESKIMEIFGTKELVNLFNEMNRELQLKILSNSFKKAAKVVIDQAQSNLKGQYRHVSQSLGMSFKKDIQTLNFGASKRLGGNLAHIANAGTQERTTKKGYYRGRVIGNFFWTNALASTESAVKEIIYTNLKTEFDRIIQKQNKIGI